MDGEAQETVLEMEVGAQIDTGRQRREQQDFIRYVQFPVAHPIARSKGNLFVLCDGVGGYLGGGVASQVAVETVIAEYYSDTEKDIEGNLRKAIEAADQRIRDEGRRLGHLNMASTIVCAIIRGEQLVVAHAGDSRAYLFRDNQLVQLTADHLEPGSDHLLTHFLGGEGVGRSEKAKVDIRKELLKDGDCILLSSDGLYNRVSERTLQELVGSRYSPQVICANMIKAANDKGGKDNIGTLHIRLKATSREARADVTSGETPLPINELARHQHTPAYTSPPQPTAYWVAVLPFLILVAIGMAIIAISSVVQFREFREAQTDAVLHLETVLDNYASEAYGPPNESFADDLDEAHRLLLQAAGLESSPQINIPSNAIRIIIPTQTPSPKESSP